MTAQETVARSRWGLEVLLDWQENQTTAAGITKRSIETTIIPGPGFHFLHGLLAGVVFVWVLPLFPPELPLWVLGPGSSIVLFALALVIHKPVTGRAPWSGRLDSVALGVSLLAHIVCGAALALLVVWPGGGASSLSRERAASSVGIRTGWRGPRATGCARPRWGSSASGGPDASYR